MSTSPAMATIPVEGVALVVASEHGAIVAVICGELRRLAVCPVLLDSHPVP